MRPRQFIRRGTTRATIMAGITADMGKRVSEQAKHRIRNRVAAGATRRSVAALEGVCLSVVHRICKGVNAGAYRRKGEAYRPSSETDRQLAKQSGWRAALESRPEADCPYGTDKIALRAAWMAAYHDNKGLMQ